METELTGPNHPPLSCGKPKYLAVLLHPSGSNGDAILELALDWAPTLNKAEFVAPHGPFALGTDENRRHWRQAAEPNGAATLDVSAERLNRFIDQLLDKRKLDDSRLALVGFGDTVPLALWVGLKRPAPLAAVVVMPTDATVDALPSGPLNESPVLLVTEPEAASGERRGRARRARSRAKASGGRDQDSTFAQCRRLPRDG